MDCIIGLMKIRQLAHPFSGRISFVLFIDSAVMLFGTVSTGFWNKYLFIPITLFDECRSIKSSKLPV